ncbi:MAG: hypothetical protein H7Y00_10725 [Fimbriimonadaceae bacterium]|nr:hypothetical protein [Chitinophagales bacterium]
MNDSTIRVFLDFIERGNDAFIAAKYFSDEFAQELFYTYEYEIPEDTLIDEEVYMEIPEDEEINTDSIFNFNEDFFQDDSYTTDNNIITTLSSQNININFVDPELSGTNGYTYIFQMQDKYEYYGWKYFTEDFIKGDTKYNVEPLGKLSSGGYNFIKIEHGRGNIYICSTPILLTNFYLIQESNLEYTSKLLSHLDEGDIVWDEFSKREYSGDYIAAQEEGPLKFILSQTSLRWAWYTIVAGVLIFIFFRSKRMQQTIPVTEPNINRSLEFVQTIGRMYYLSEDKKQLIHQKMKLLQYFIKNKYKLSAASVSEDFISKLSMKSQISEQDLKYIFNTYQYLEKQFEVTDKDLMDFHHLTDTFYKTCK